MGYITQEEIQPITAKEYLVKNWRNYHVTDTKEEFIALLNILQACGENLDSLHDVCVNGITEFCDIVHFSGWESDRDVADTLFEFCAFYREKDFIDMILDQVENYDNVNEWALAIIDEARDDVNGNNDVQISKTEDGYVKRIWC